MNQAEEAWVLPDRTLKGGHRKGVGKGGRLGEDEMSLENYKRFRMDDWR